MKWLLLALLLAVPTPTPRSSTARERFLREQGWPHGRPGYVVDHVLSLKRGGKDSSDNMIFQNVEDSRCKDSYEQWVPLEVLVVHFGKGAMADPQENARLRERVALYRRQVRP